MNCYDYVKIIEDVRRLKENIVLISDFAKTISKEMDYVESLLSDRTIVEPYNPEKEEYIKKLEKNIDLFSRHFDNVFSYLKSKGLDNDFIEYLKTNRSSK